MRRELRIEGRTIGDDQECYVIAELGHNHQGDIEVCKQLIDAARACGASAVKLQKRDNRTLYTREMYDSVYSSENAFGDTYGRHRERLEFDRDAFAELQQYSRQVGMTLFATVFDLPSADLLNDLGVPAFKIASGDLKSLSLLAHVARMGKPLFISTGGGTLDDVRRAYETVRPLNEQICLMQCTATYPSDYPEVNLRVIDTYRREFPEIPIGFSSHDNGIAMDLVSYVIGARVIEKHFTLNRAWKGTDHSFSLEPQGLAKLVRDIRRARVALGDGVKRAYPSEAPALRKMGKKLVVAHDLPRGHALTEADFLLQSPGDGLPPSELGALVGRRLLRDLSSGTTLTLADLAP